MAYMNTISEVHLKSPPPRYTLLTTSPVKMFYALSLFIYKWIFLYILYYIGHFRTQKLLDRFSEKWPTFSGGSTI